VVLFESTSTTVTALLDWGGFLLYDDFISKQLMNKCYFDNNRDEELWFANLLNHLSNDIISGRVRLIEADHERETRTLFETGVGITSLTGRETLSIHFHRLSQEDNKVEGNSYVS